MKRTLLFTIIFFSFIMLMMIISCESLGVDSGSQVQVDDPSGKIPQALENDDKLGDPVFTKLPPEVKSYLRALSSAFQNHDADFLLAQGEAMFEKLVGPYYDDEEYFIMLYRIGGGIWDIPSFSKISRIEYTGWESGDPVMEIRGRLFYSDIEFFPCRLMLDWKLDEPKIIGTYP